jgi:hypothetical protein
VQRRERRGKREKREKREKKEKKPNVNLNSNGLIFETSV